MIIGIIGGVGSGKSTVLDYLEEKYNANIIKSDLVAKDIMTPGHKVYHKVLSTFPEVNDNGNIDRTKLAEIVFNDKDKLNLLNSITHPGTIDEINRLIDISKSDVTVVESAILIGSGIEKRCHELWFVYCEREERIRRLISSRGYSRQKAIDIINSQPDDDEYNFYADECIDNSSTPSSTMEQIDLIMNREIC